MTKVEWKLWSRLTAGSWRASNFDDKPQSGPTSWTSTVPPCAL